MEVVDERAALLSNYEVAAFLKEQTELQKNFGAEHSNLGGLNFWGENLLTVQFETSDYLSKTACSTQDARQVQDFLAIFKQYPLTKAERLEILNSRPRNIVELVVLIEECEERFGQQDLEGILDKIAQVLPRDETQDELMDDEEEAEGPITNGHAHLPNGNAEEYEIKYEDTEMAHPDECVQEGDELVDDAGRDSDGDAQDDEE
ncbi:hypothetical protein BZG36_04750 [Bifiguratus adelaidae]|uniref:DNA-directed RNA polymerase III subunit RPC9 n=1 Tax=Bifiguratus adelaidae TaxID=1938954 RepID=A0A261XV22_9FUNG|nr:hypothetical protein BZG36_04750 [Bifiguratus adelaidae]